MRFFNQSHYITIHETKEHFYLHYTSLNYETSVDY